MKNKKLIYLFAFSLSILFTILYVSAFQFYIPSEQVQSETLYMNQVGLYKEKGNAQKVSKDLKTKDLESYIYQKDSIYVVVSGVSEEKKLSDENGKKLKDASYSYIQKEVKMKDNDIIKNIQNKNYQKALELIADQS